MGIGQRRLVLAAVIIMQLISLAYVFPKMGSPRAVVFESLWSRMCANSGDLFEANSRFFKIRPFMYIMDDRVSMYYADLMPKPGKNYLMYFGSVPPDVSQRYDLTVKNGQEVYLLKGVTWDQFIEEYLFTMEEYLWGDFPVLVRRKDRDPYVDFTRSYSRHHGEE